MQASDNVTRLHSSFPQDSELYFPVVERRDGWQDRKGAWHYDDSVKKLVRMVGDEPIVLATVNSTYRTTTNRDLFTYVEEHMQSKFPHSMLADVSVRDDMAYNGRDCFRHYTFPSIRCDIRGGGDVAFKIIVGNGYGSKAIMLMVGAIDFFCTNGCVIGVYEKVVRKHTSGMTLSGLDQWLDSSVVAFTKHTERMLVWADTQIMPYVADMFAHLTDKHLLSPRQAEQMRYDTILERDRRTQGDPVSLWHMYSALTNWATHDNVRDTGNDHAAVTRIERGKHVERVINAAHLFVQQAQRAA